MFMLTGLLLMILGLLSVVLLFVCLICRYVPGCSMYNHYKNTPNQVQIVYVPQPSFGHPPAYGGYQVVPGNEGPPIPTGPSPAPPLYMQTIFQHPQSAAFLQPPNQSNTPPCSDELTNPPDKPPHHP